LGLVENLIEVDTIFSDLFCENTQILKWLCAKIQPGEVDANKLYSMEILSILVQQSSSSHELFDSKFNGIENLLNALVPYENIINPESPEEEEFIENLFDAVCACLQSKKLEESFVSKQGIELMILMIKNHSYTSNSAYKTLSYALLSTEDSCKRFVDAFGLKTIFATFGKFFSKKEKKENKKLEEHILSCLYSLLKNLVGKNKESGLRVVNKFLESDFEKAKVLMKFHVKYADLSIECDKAILKDQQMKKRAPTEEELSEFQMKRLDGGLYTLCLIDLIIGTLCLENDSLKQEFISLFKQNKRSTKEIISYLKESATFNADSDSKEAENEKNKLQKMIELF